VRIRDLLGVDVPLIVGLEVSILVGLEVTLCLIIREDVILLVSLTPESKLKQRSLQK